jgi:hypothetical protein
VTPRNGTFRGGWGFYFIKTTRNRERLGEVGASRFVKTTRCRGKFRRIWIFNILGLVTNQIVHIRVSCYVLIDSSCGQNVLCAGGLLWLYVCVYTRFISAIHCILIKFDIGDRPSLLLRDFRFNPHLFSYRFYSQVKSSFSSFLQNMLL